MIEIIKVDTRFDSDAAYCGKNIPVPGWANYIATDSSGNIWAFEYEPIPFRNTTFHIGTGRSARIGIGRLTVPAKPIQTLEKLKPRETPAKNNSPKAPMSKRGANACRTFESWTTPGASFMLEGEWLKREPENSLLTTQAGINAEIKQAANCALSTFAPLDSGLKCAKSEMEAVSILAAKIVWKLSWTSDFVGVDDVLEAVLRHIEEYTVPQYGDEGADQIDSWTVEDCLKQVARYANRIETSQREEGNLDMLKSLHYLQLAYEKLESEVDE